MNKGDHVLNGILLAVGLGYVLHPDGGLETFETIAATLVPVVLGTLFPDVDTDFGKHRKTLHSLPVLAVLYAFPFYFGNLQWVWVGVLSHYVLDVVGSRRGIALFYPLSDQEYGLPVGVTTSSKWATTVTVVITILELAVVAAVLYLAPQVIPMETVETFL
ncbi:metal-dependent hydrolase [Halobacterium jilantaiense]|uniref:LexA-binding, inner membrane-associated putative hydrolase n=1 Tax=Halobacterium jilantaiense TaxID=355548 RepID=A0A1I0NVJ9_9EURY|nr:metal-dependent hydrolase [Halobacterium jilantaiense]SEW05642.1 LexA-binding, inner membrane-associated putative hydrolase [Halobacterium jilantaiense]